MKDIVKRLIVVVSLTMVVAACGGSGSSKAASTSTSTKAKTTSTTVSAVPKGTCGPRDATCDQCAGGRVWSVTDGCTFSGAPTSAGNPVPTDDSTHGCADLSKYVSSGNQDAFAMVSAQAYFGFDPAWKAALAAPTAQGLDQLNSFFLVTVKAWCQGHGIYHA